MITKNNKPLSVEFFDWQLEFFFNIVRGINLKKKRDHTPRFNICNKGRRLGATNGAAFKSDLALISQNDCLWVDTIQGNLTPYYNLYHYPIMNQIKSKYWNYSKSDKVLTFEKNRIDFRSVQKPENIEGFAYNYLFINEAGITLKGLRGRLLWQQTLLPMIMERKPTVYIFGTPKGKRAKKDEMNLSQDGNSLYYEMYEKGLDPENKDWCTMQYSSYNNPNLSHSDIDNLKKEFHPLIQRQEIYGEFIDLNGAPIIQKDWIEIVDSLPPREEWERVIISSDTAFKIGSENDDSAIVTILEAKTGYYIIDCVARKMEFPELSKQAQKIYDNILRVFGNKLKYFLIEDAASGQSLYQVLNKGTRMRLKKTVPRGDKYTRAVGTTILFESRNVKVLKNNNWNKKLIDQLTTFNETMDTPDDIVDAVVYGLMYFLNIQRGFAV